MEFKRQTNRSTRQDSTTNINLFLRNFSFAVVTSEYWGNFKDGRNSEHKPHDERNPLIEIDLDGKSYEYTLEELKELLRSVLK
jgi:hypothetical protein